MLGGWAGRGRGEHPVTADIADSHAGGRVAAGQRSQVRVPLASDALRPSAKYVMRQDIVVNGGTSAVGGVDGSEGRRGLSPRL